MILVFKKGSTHKFQGIDCELKRIDHGKLSSYEKQGWILDHRKLYPAAEQPKAPEATVAQNFKKPKKG